MEDKYKIVSLYDRSYKKFKEILKTKKQTGVKLMENVVNELYERYVIKEGLREDEIYVMMRKNTKKLLDKMLDFYNVSVYDYLDKVILRGYKETEARFQR